MCDEWMPRLELALTREQFHRLPRHPAYRYEHVLGSAWLTPRPRFYHALLDLRPLAHAPWNDRVRLLRADDWAALVPVFAESFRAQQPFAGLEDSARREAAALPASQRVITESHTDRQSTFLVRASEPVRLVWW